MVSYKRLLGTADEIVHIIDATANPFWPYGIDNGVKDEYVSSIYANSTWEVYRPGEDKTFPTMWTLREGSAFHACLPTLRDILRCAELCEVELLWQPQEEPDDAPILRRFHHEAPSPSLQRSSGNRG